MAAAEDLVSAMTLRHPEADGLALQAARGAAGMTRKLLADRLGVQVSMVIAWERGDAMVPRRHHKALRAMFETWRPTSAESDKVDSSPHPVTRLAQWGPAEAEIPSPLDPRGGATLGEDGGEISALERIDRQIKRIEKRLRGKVSGPELIKHEASLARWITMRAKLDGSLDITESQVVRSRPFREAMRKLLRAIEPYPEAVAAVAKAFQE